MQTIPDMPERKIQILRHDGKVPALASCTKCQRKFFTPASYFNDPFGAREYLQGKFDQHECAGEPRRLPYKW
jgi:hypothetical protein